MLFSDEIEPCCAYCSRGINLGREEVLCKKRGVMMATDYCSSYRYEPTRRVPRVAPRLKVTELSKEDFSLQ